MFSPAGSRAASAYKKVGIETSVDGADPHRLVALLFDALLQALANARAAMERGDTQRKGEQIVRAVRFLEEGLKAGLNTANEDELVLNLRGVYDYSIARLTQANFRNDMKLLDEVIGLIEPLADAWNTIGAKAASPARQPSSQAPQASQAIGVQ
ncbi:MAG TPA: flagellar export chaperone FliS [Burkholderiaceae bacterium]|nr:flagellar export chaperone FliS [Burkholderiaceae bacterium]